MTKAEKIFMEYVVEDLGVVTGNTSGIHAKDYRISSRGYKGKDMFATCMGTDVARIRYIKAGVIDEKNSFTRWFLDEVYKDENSGGGGKKESSGGSKKSSGGGLFGSSSDDDSDGPERESAPAPEPIPMSPEERAIVESPIEVKSTPAEELEWLVEHYLVVSKITSQVSYEIGLINSKIEALKECIVKLPIPADITRLFALAMAVETYIKKNNMFNDIPGKEIKKLRSNIADHMKRPDMKHNAEVHAKAEPLMEDDLFKKTPIYDRIIIDKIEDASARGLAEDADFIAKHFNAHLEARDALRNMKIVTEREEMLKVAKVLQKAMEDAGKYGSAAMGKAVNEMKSSSSPFGAITGGIGMMKEGMNKATIGTLGTLKDSAKGMMQGKITIPQTDFGVYREKLLELLDKADQLFSGDAEFAAIRDAVEVAKKKKRKRNIIIVVSLVVFWLLLMLILVLALFM